MKPAQLSSANRSRLQAAAQQRDELAERSRERWVLRFQGVDESLSCRLVRRAGDLRRAGGEELLLL